LTVDELQSSSIGNAQRTKVPPHCLGGWICLPGGNSGRLGEPDSISTTPKSSLVMHSLAVKEFVLLLPQMPLLLQVH